MSEKEVEPTEEQLEEQVGQLVDQIVKITDGMTAQVIAASLIDVLGYIMARQVVLLKQGRLETSLKVQECIHEAYDFHLVNIPRKMAEQN